MLAEEVVAWLVVKMDLVAQATWSFCQVQWEDVTLNKNV